MALTQKQLKDVCLLHQGFNQCRYLSQDDAPFYGKYHCLKKTPHRKVIDEELRETAAKYRQQGQDLRKQGIPMGDNCGGYLLLRLIDQGYDVKSP